MEGNLIDNKQYGRLGDVLKRTINKDSKLSITASYFTLYAFEELKEELSKIDSLRFIYTEPTFVKNDNKNIMKKVKENENKLFGVEEELKDRCTLNQSYIARELAKWIKRKVEIKSFKNTKMNGALCHIDNVDNNVSITGATYLSCPSLGYINSTSMYLNTYEVSNSNNQKVTKTISITVEESTPSGNEPIKEETQSTPQGTGSNNTASNTNNPSTGDGGMMGYLAAASTSLGTLLFASKRKRK